MEKSLHIVTLNIPYPPDYGGMIDTFYRIKALHSIGIKIDLHCFEYGRDKLEDTDSFCQTVNYYKRKRGVINTMSGLPFIVESRRSDKLLRNLLKDNHPILFDGIHTTYLLGHPLLANRKKFVRAHNKEHLYYKSLAQADTNVLRKIFNRIEASKLQRYEEVLKKADMIFTISNPDQEYFKAEYNNAVLCEPFHPFEKIETLTGKGEYVLFHADLSVAGNESAANFLCTEVFPEINLKCIIAGKAPSPALASAISKQENIELIPGPSLAEMNKLIKNAHVIVLFGDSSNGFRIRLLSSLFAGRHLVANRKILSGTGLESYFILADTGQEIIEAIAGVSDKLLAEDEIEKRRELILNRFSNSRNAETLAELIFR